MGSSTISLWRRAKASGYHVCFALFLCVGVGCFGFVWFLVCHLVPRFSTSYCMTSLNSKKSSDRQSLELDRLQRKKKDCLLSLLEKGCLGGWSNLRWFVCLGQPFFALWAVPWQIRLLASLLHLEDHPSL